jgi:hypothetical protein
MKIDPALKKISFITTEKKGQLPALGKMYIRT